MENLLVQISEFTKKEVAALAKSHASEYGHATLSAYVAAKKIETYAKQVIAEMQADATALAELLTAEERKEYSGAKITLKAPKTEHDFTGSKEWVKLFEKETRIEEDLKEVEEQRKALEELLVVQGKAPAEKVGKPTLAVTII